MHWRNLQVWTAVGALLLAGGCATHKQVPRAAFTPNYAPTNVAADAVVPASVRRVVVLPLYYGADPDSEFVRELDALLQAQLGRTGEFEVVPIPRDRLEALFGFTQVESVDVLPADFLEKLRTEYGADAVELTDLTVNRPYRPISMGLRAKLVDLQTGRIFWAVDTVFDSADPAVAVAARKFAGAATYNPYPLDTSTSILQSPRRFADFVAWSLYRTLPPRRYPSHK